MSLSSESASSGVPSPSASSGLSLGQGSVEAQARAYLDVNCAHCHRPEGWAPGDVELDLRYETELEATGLCETMKYFEWAGIPRVAPGDPERSGLLARFLRDHEQVVHDVLRLALEFLAKIRVLGGDADGTGVEMTLAHHDAAHRDERCRAQSDLLGAEQRPDDHITAGFHLAVRLQDYAASKVVHDKRLVGFGNSQFPRQTCMLDACQR